MIRRRIAGLTIRQPWASLIAHGPKRTENRTWLPDLEPGEFLAIHAGKFVARHGETADEWAAACALYFKHHATIGPVPLLDAAAKVPDRQRGDRFDPWRHFIETAVPYGAVIAVAKYNGALRDPTPGDPWRVQRHDLYGWQLYDVVALPHPVPCRGAQGLWDLRGDVRDVVRAQYLTIIKARAST